ncbi:MAG: glycerol kinase GlpK [Phycisphaerales bacterium]|nr:glycerol kinase GlpK [Phycisphaerales bacterium]
MPLVVALDQGTTSSRALVVDEEGTVRASAQREFAQHFPRPGWVEHDAEKIWSSQSRVMAEAIAAAGAGPSALAAIGITNQRETVVVWERATGHPIHRAIVWQDRRTTEACSRLRAEGVEDLVTARTGLLIDPYFSATKIAWILDAVDGARERAERGELAFGTIDSWLAWCLTGGAIHAIDATNASRTMLYDIRRGVWDDELLRVFHVPRAVLPDVRNTAGVIGSCQTVEAARGVPIAALVGDQQGALFGQACFAPGEAKCTYGTGCFMLLATGTECPASHNRLLTTVAWRLADGMWYALEGSVFVGGAVVQWMRDGLGIIQAAEEVNTLAASVPDTGDVLLVPAFAGLGAPYWDPRARGLLIGITRGTTAAHLARAALESIAFQVVDLAGAMERDAGHQIDVLRVDGGAAASDLLLQIQADLLQRCVERPRTLETTSLGAAYLAGLAVGVWRRPAEIAVLRVVDRRFEPSISAAESASRRERWHEAVERARGWAREDD